VTREILTILTIKLEQFVDQFKSAKVVICDRQRGYRCENSLNLSAYMDISTSTGLNESNFDGKLGTLNSEFAWLATTKKGHPSMRSAIVGSTELSPKMNEHCGHGQRLQVAASAIAVLLTPSTPVPAPIPGTAPVGRRVDRSSHPE
jgi:hypothetical protein